MRELARLVRAAGCSRVGSCVHRVQPQCKGLDKLLLVVVRPVYEYEPSKDNEKLWTSEAMGTAIYERGMMKRIITRIEVCINFMTNTPEFGLFMFLF